MSVNAYMCSGHDFNEKIYTLLSLHDKRTLLAKREPT